jgi:hypothetical protein
MSATPEFSGTENNRAGFDCALLILVFGGRAGVLFAISPVISAGAALLSFAEVKIRRGASGAARVVTLLLAVGEAWWYGSSWFALLVVVVGTALLLIGNKQLAAGIAM